MRAVDHIARHQTHFTRDAEAVARDLESYANLLEKWQKVQNLVSRETLGEIWTRHFADSLQALNCFTDDDRRFMDLGSGGGFPALPLAIARKGSGQTFTLVEPTARKVSFLRTVARELDLNVTVIGRRTDEIDSRETGQPDVITSRALASLKQLCEWMEPFWGANTKAILHKGREHVEEVAETAALWDFDVLTSQSDTDPGSAILEIRNLRRKSVR